MPALTAPVALITGSAKRLGAALAHHLDGLGYRVAVHYRASRAEAEAVASTLSDAAAFQADLLDPLACEELIRSVVAHFGRLDVLINNVGDYTPTPILDHPIDVWKATIDSNLHTCFYMCHYALPVLRESPRARIINVGLAGIGRVPAATQSTAYVAAKLGVLALTRSLAVAVGDAPFTVNMVSPGILEDPVAGPPPARIPKGRYGHPDELAAAVGYLVSEAADYVTGQHIEVAGGWGL